MGKATIRNGSYRGNTVDGTYTLIREWKQGARDSFVTVLDDHGDFGEVGRTIRVKCAAEDVQYEHGPAVTSTAAAVPEVVETDEETMARIEKTFSFIPVLSSAAQKGQITALIISGPAGVGKSYGVENQLQKLNMPRTLAGKREQYEMITGACSPIGLFKTLYMNRHRGNVVVFDDCDEILWDEACLNMLKGALDTKPRRKISWLTESRALDREDVPNEFYFEGSVIFLTNLKFDNVRSKKIEAHLGALMSRSHYLDLSLDTRREQILRITQVVQCGMLDKHDLSDSTKSEVVNWVIDNQDYVRELSLRTVIKAADLAVSHRDQWQDIAEHSLINPALLRRKRAQSQRAAAVSEAA